MRLFPKEQVALFVRQTSENILKFEEALRYSIVKKIEMKKPHAKISTIVMTMNRDYKP